MNDVVEKLNAATNIPFPEFVGSLVESVFDTVLETNLRQTESYIDLVKEVSQPLSDYINNTKDDTTPIEMIQVLSEFPNLPLPKTENNTGDPEDLAELLIDQITRAADSSADGSIDLQGTMLADLLGAEPKSKVDPDVVNKLNQAASISGIITSVAGGLKDVTGAVGQIVAQQDSADDFGELIAWDSDTLTYDPVKFSELKTEPKINAATLALGKLWDAISENVAANKYAILQEMVKLGLVRIVVGDGLVEAAMTFESMTREVDVKETKFRNKSLKKSKVTNKTKNGLLRRIFRGKNKTRSKNKSRVVNVSTVKTKHLNMSQDKGSLFGRVVINWHTDYLPVSEA